MSNNIYNKIILDLKIQKEEREGTYDKENNLVRKEKSCMYGDCPSPFRINRNITDSFINNLLIKPLFIGQKEGQTVPER